MLDGIAGERPVAWELADIVVDIAVRRVGQAALKQFLRHGLHLRNMVGCLWAEMRRQDVQGGSIIEVLLRVVGSNLVGRTACDAGLVLQFIFAALLYVVLQVADIGDIAHQQDIVVVVFQHAAQQVCHHEGA